MKKAKLLGTLLCAACLVTGSIAPSVPVMADGMTVVTLGADLTQDQKNTMLKYFKVVLILFRSSMLLIRMREST